MLPTSVCFLIFEIEIIYVLESLASPIPSFVFLFGDLTGNTRSNNPLQLGQAGNDIHLQIE
jgi:hypothetical protein